MPGSSDIFSIELERILTNLNPSNILDVGIGAGKYGMLLKRLNPNCNITGCEIDSQYLLDYKTNHVVYDKILNTSIIDIVDTMEIEYDLVIFGDILEHLKRSSVIDCLDYFQYRSKHILLSYPTKLRQGIWFGHISERHMSELKLQELVQNYDIIHYEKKQDAGFLMNLCLIRGYL